GGRETTTQRAEDNLPARPREKGVRGPPMPANKSPPAAPPPPFVFPPPPIPQPRHTRNRHTDSRRRLPSHNLAPTEHKNHRSRGTAMWRRPTQRQRLRPTKARSLHGGNALRANCRPTYCRTNCQAIYRQTNYLDLTKQPDLGQRTCWDQQPP